MATATTGNLRSWATPLIIGSYLITGISGVMLFFHLGESLIKEAHEWIGMLFAIGATLHITSHWTPFKRYFTRPLAVSVIAVSLVAGTTFIVGAAGEEGGSPVRAVMHTIEQAPLATVAQLQQRDERELVTLLEGAGYEVTDVGESVQTIAAVNNRSAREIIPLLFRQAAAK